MHRGKVSEKCSFAFLDRDRIAATFWSLRAVSRFVSIWLFSHRPAAGCRRQRVLFRVFWFSSEARSVRAFWWFALKSSNSGESRKEKTLPPFGGQGPRKSL